MVVVDDHDGLRMLFTDILHSADYCVVPAENGAVALAYLQATAELPALILLDLDMPVMNGWAFREAQRQDPRLAPIPVIVCTAEPTGARTPALRADGYLRKPFRPLDLLTMVAAAIERHP